MNAAKRSVLSAWRRLLHRRHRYSRADLDVSNWPHPRPARDPRLQHLVLGLSWSAIVQMVFGPSPSAVQTAAQFGLFASISLGALTVAASALLLYAAWCHSQYWSFATELCSCIGFLMVFGIYSVALVTAVSDWYGTTLAGIAITLATGNLRRGVTLAARFW